MMQVVKEEKCFICGHVVDFEIHEKATLFREAKCPYCGASLRNSDVARTILKTILKLSEMDLVKKGECLKKELINLAEFRILNTCSSGTLHNTLCGLPGYTASEYFDDIPNGEVKGKVVSADLMNLPFRDNSFDLIISEDVFEHIYNYEKGFSEVYRVLTAGGYHVFTVPLHEGRKTVSRIENEKKIYHGDPIREGGALVITDFGSDLPDILNKMRFPTKMEKIHVFYNADEITDADKSYDEFLSKINRMDEYFKYNSEVFVSCKASEKVKQGWFGIVEKSKNREYGKEILRAQYIKSIAIESFDANKDIETPDGCYKVEGDEGSKFVWATIEVNCVLLLPLGKANVVVEGYVNFDMYRAKGISEFKIDLIDGYEDSIFASATYTENSIVKLCLNISSYEEKGIVPIKIMASSYVCPEEDGTGEDTRKLSWILNKIYVQ